MWNLEASASVYEKTPLGVLIPNRRSLKHGIYGSFEARNFKLSATKFLNCPRHGILIYKILDPRRFKRRSSGATDR